MFSACYLKGTFKLRSGQISNEYFDKYRFESQPELLRSVAFHLKSQLPSDTQALAGLEMGGIPIATALSLETGLPVVFVRKTPKEYGTCLFAEGIDIQNKKLCVIEDVITTGGQVLISTEDLRKSGAIIDTVLCAILRGDKNNPQFKNANLTIKSLFSADELKQA
ncbi:MAG: orotate phosphoribosyltransferase [Bdellovibrionaceae bacterium]|nr:orotate phosphoribosyltransferase [Pseudobdellovibrionaceae bacterium]